MGGEGGAVGVEGVEGGEGGHGGGHGGGEGGGNGDGREAEHGGRGTGHAELGQAGEGFFVGALRTRGSLAGGGEVRVLNRELTVGAVRVSTHGD